MKNFKRKIRPNQKFGKRSDGMVGLKNDPAEGSKNIIAKKIKHISDSVSANNPSNIKKIYSLTKRAAFMTDAEAAHTAAIGVLKFGLLSRLKILEYEALRVNVCGIDFPNPVGVAAGFDKNAEVVRQLLDIGFGSVEVGTVTPKPQSGNAKPRLFRIVENEALINRMGFNSEGHEVVKQRLEKIREDEDWLNSESRGRFGVNIGANKESDNFIADYRSGISVFHNLVDFITVNISSPNTPGLRDYQKGDKLKKLLSEVNEEKLKQNCSVPIFVKISPDLSNEEIDQICREVELCEISAVIIGNTTTTRPGLEANSPLVKETGGLSGKPLRSLSLKVLKQVRSSLSYNIPIIGAGGVDDYFSAIERIDAGAELLQLYTGMVYRGPTIAVEVNETLNTEVKKRQLENISEIAQNLKDEMKKQSKTSLAKK